MKDLALITSLVLLPLTMAHATESTDAFVQGQTYFTLEAGSGSAYNNNYLILGAGVNYFLEDGFSIGLTYDNWSGSSPGINQVTPSIQYVFYDAASIKPYLGAFYRRSFVNGQGDLNSAGVRVGGYIYASRHAAIGVGLAAEHYTNCQSAFGACSQTYPEVSVIFRY